MHHHSSHPRIPEALRPYIGLPRRDTLTLVTGILGATTNWIVLRFIAAAAAYNNDDIKSTRPGIDDAFASEKDESEELGNSQISNRWSGNEKIGEQNEAAKKKTMGSAGDRRRKGEVAVVLVSWMRDVDFWRTEGMKAVGIDIARLAEKGRFAFVDGLTELFSGSGGHDNAGEGKDEEAPNKVDALYSASSPSSATSPAASSKTLSSTAIATARAPPQSSLPLRNHPEKEERFKRESLQPSLPSASSKTPIRTPSKHQRSTTAYKLTSPTQHHLEEIVSQAIASVAKSSSVLLILDSPDLFLAATSTPPHPSQPSSLPPTSAISLTTTLQRLRSHPKVHSTIITLCADGPLLFPSGHDHMQDATLSLSSFSSSSSSLQPHHAAFVTGLAHDASSILSVRLLDTGFAGDVSGVLRVSVGGGSGMDIGRGKVKRRMGNAWQEDGGENDRYNEDDDNSDDGDDNDEDGELSSDDDDDDDDMAYMEDRERRGSDAGPARTGSEMLYFVGAGGDVKVFN